MSNIIYIIRLHGAEMHGTTSRREGTITYYKSLSFELATDLGLTLILVLIVNNYK